MLTYMYENHEIPMPHTCSNQEMHPDPEQWGGGRC